MGSEVQKPKKAVSDAQKRLTLRTRAKTGLGKVISYVQKHPQGDQDLVSQTLNARFLPFVLDKKNAKDRAIARQCMLKCLGYMLAHREADLCEIANEWDLAIPGVGMATVVSNGNNNGSGNNASGEDAELEIAAQKKRRQENLRVMDGIMGL